MSGYIYIGSDSSGTFKIGITNDVKKRERQFKTGNPTYVMLTSFFVDNPAVIEIELHTKFSSRRIAGEWFNLSPEDLYYIHKRFNVDKDRSLDDFKMVHKIVCVEKKLSDFSYLKEIKRFMENS